MGKLIDLSNKRFGFWLALKPGSKSKSGQTQWLCQCECGIKKEITSNSLRSGNSTSCGCNHAPDLTNLVFGDLTVLNLESHNDGIRKWNCKCSCGNNTIVNTYKLRQNIITSCGCRTITRSQILSDKFAQLRVRNNSIIQCSLIIMKKQNELIIDLNNELQKSFDLIAQLKKKEKVI